jgi:hypothetical protein
VGLACAFSGEHAIEKSRLFAHESDASNAPPHVPELQPWHTVAPGCHMCRQVFDDCMCVLLCSGLQLTVFSTPLVVYLRLHMVSLGWLVESRYGGRVGGCW